MRKVHDDWERVCRVNLPNETISIVKHTVVCMCFQVTTPVLCLLSSYATLHSVQVHVGLFQVSLEYKEDILNFETL